MNLIESWDEYDDGPYEGDEPPLEGYVLKTGTVVYHGTNADFDERDGLDGPFWVTNSQEVAEYFTKWNGHGGDTRITIWEVATDIPLAVVTKDWLEWCYEYQHVEHSEPQDYVPLLRKHGYEGWTIPDNYGPSKADIFLRDDSDLKYVDTKRIR